MSNRYYILTIPEHAHTSDTIKSVFNTGKLSYLAGQLEHGQSTGYYHWQLVAYFKKTIRIPGVKVLFGPQTHAEPTRSSAAREYVLKDETSIQGTRFELGSLPTRRNNSKDWEDIKNKAKLGDLDALPADVYVIHYRTLKQIAVDHMQPDGIERHIVCYWGSTGLGKSRRAWSEAGLDAYPKDPRSVFWCGYAGQKHVVLDEFRGGIDISHILRWFDRYPVIVQIKGSSTVLRATKMWVTSNLPPQAWFRELDDQTVQALLRRMEVVHVTEEWIPPLVS